MPRDMTEEELRDFEEKELHHGAGGSAGGPASESELVQDKQPDRPSGDPEFPPLNPD